MVHLAQKGVQEPSPFLCAQIDQVGIRRRNHNHRQKAYVVGKPFVGLVVAFKVFPLTASPVYSQPNLVHRPVVHRIIAGNGGAVFTVADAERVLEIEETLGHGKAVDSVQEIGLPTAV